MTERTLNFIFVDILVAVIALTIGSAALLRVAACMLIMLALALASALLALITLNVDAGAQNRRVERGQKAAFTLMLRYTSPLPAGNIYFTASVGAAKLRENAIEARVLPFQRCMAQFEAQFKHRGVYPLGGGRLTVEDVFGLFHFSKNIRARSASIVVTPCLRRVAAMEMRVGEAGSETQRRFPDDASSPSGVREWRDGDLLKRVHWKLTMKRYDPTHRNIQPMVKTYDEAARPDTIILPDLTPVDAVTERALTIEDAVCEACLAIANAQLAGDNPVKLLLWSAAPSEVGGVSVSDTPAIVEALTYARFDSPASYEEALYEAARRLDRTGALVLVTPRLTLRVADTAIRIRQTSGMCVAVVWITDTLRADAEALISRMELKDVITRRDNPFK